MEDFIAWGLWSNLEVGYSFSDSIGRSGGILTLWRKDMMEVLNSFKGEGFLGIKVKWKENFYYVVNIYSSCVLQKKKDLWDNLLKLKSSFSDGEWIFGGDFNASKNVHERKGRSIRDMESGSELFAKFIVNSGLVDVPSKGKKFTWYSGDGRSMSRIDRFLVSSKIINDWGVVGQLVGDRDISDHCPVWFVVDKLNWGPKPFKFNNEWFTFSSFLPFVEKDWKDLVMEGRGDYVLKEKLSRIKGRLRWWNKTIFGRIDLEVEEGVRDINEGDSRLEDTTKDLIGESLLDRQEANKRFWLNLRIKEIMLVQKSRLKWLNEGDSNSAFFHKVVKERRRFNHIGPIVTQ
ncbi:uncharacterized protein LOC131644227 [Vicia villosa]|uniref:uncharacterized protein LOC131644227 n=1 Tax=Vicia villosa TaxID=3911 RepID=UPI00273B9BBE|nr:uncharacterized protein LOC131644227 [Vicia villosa]